MCGRACIRPLLPQKTLLNGNDVIQRMSEDKKMREKERESEKDCVRLSGLFCARTINLSDRLAVSFLYKKKNTNIDSTFPAEYRRRMCLRVCVLFVIQIQNLINLIFSTSI